MNGVPWWFMDGQPLRSVDPTGCWRRRCRVRGCWAASVHFASTVQEPRTLPGAPATRSSPPPRARRQPDLVGGVSADGVRPMRDDCTHVDATWHRGGADGEVSTCSDRLLEETRSSSGRPCGGPLRRKRGGLGTGVETTRPSLRPLSSGQVLDVALRRSSGLSRIRGRAAGLGATARARGRCALRESGSVRVELPVGRGVGLQTVDVLTPRSSLGASVEHIPEQASPSRHELLLVCGTAASRPVDDRFSP